MNKIALFIALASFSIFAKAISHQEVWEAAKDGRWEEVRNAISIDPAVVDYAPTESPDRAASILWFVAAYGQWDLVRTMLQNNPSANIDAAPLEGPDRGASILWFVAVNKQWDLVRSMLQNNPSANIDAAPLEGVNRGRSVLWFAAANKQWDLVRTMLQNNPSANVDAAPMEGPGRGKSVLWAAALDCQWNLVRTVLQNNPSANINAAPMEGPSEGQSVLWAAASYRQWDLVRTMLQNNPSAIINAAPMEGLNRGWSVLRIASESKQWDLITRMLLGNPNVLGFRALAILDLSKTTPSVEHSALATLAVHADNLWNEPNFLFKLTPPQRTTHWQMREAIQSVAKNCLRSWASQDDSFLTCSLLPSDIQNLIALHSMRTHSCLENVPNHLLMPLLQAQLQRNNREWLARQTARRAFEERFGFMQTPARTLDAPYSAANTEATAKVIMATLKHGFRLNALTRVEAEAFARKAATHVARLNQLTPENIKTAVQRSNKRSSEEDCPPAKRQICQQIKDPLKSRQGTRRSGERASFEEREIAEDAEVSDPVLRALGLNRAAAIELILGAADDGAIRTLVATEIQMAALAHQLPSLMQAPTGLSADAFFEWAMRRDTFENYVAAVLGHQEGRIGYYFATAGLLGALAQLTHTHLTIWLPEADSHEVYPAYEGTGQGHRRVDLLHTNGMTEFTLLTQEQAVVPMAIDAMPVVRAATPTPPLSRSAVLQPASPLGGVVSGQMRSPL